MINRFNSEMILFALKSNCCRSALSYCEIASDGVVTYNSLFANSIGLIKISSLRSFTV